MQIYAVETVDEAVSVLTGEPAGEPDEEGNYPEGTINYRVEQRLQALAERAREFASKDDEE